MAELPNKASFTDTAVSKGGFRAALDQLNDYLAGLLDTAGTAAAARDKLGLKDGATTTVKAIRDGLLEPGTRAVFYQATAPLGWTQVASINDRVLRVVSGPGGGSGGGWTITGLSATTSVTVAGHVLTVAQLPAHDHIQTLNGDTSVNASGNGAPANGWSSQSTGVAEQRANRTWATGSGQPHAHGATADTSVSQSGSWRPSYIDVIVCERGSQ